MFKYSAFFMSILSVTSVALAQPAHVHAQQQDMMMSPSPAGNTSGFNIPNEPQIGKKIPSDSLNQHLDNQDLNKLPIPSQYQRWVTCGDKYVLINSITHTVIKVLPKK